MIGMCRHDASIDDSFEHVVCQASKQDNECCGNDLEKKYKHSEFEIDNCPSCKCLLSSAVEDKINYMIKYSGVGKIFHAPQFAHGLYMSFKFNNQYRSGTQHN